MNVKQHILNFVESKVSAILTSAGTVLTGVSSAMEWIPEVLGFIATFIGIILSVVLIYTHLRNGRAEHKKIKTETKLLNMKVENLERQRNEQYS